MNQSRRLLALACTSRLTFVAAVLSGLAAGLLTVGQAWYLSATVDAVFLKGQLLAQVWVWLRNILLIITIRAVLIWLVEVSAGALAVRIKTALREQLLEKIQRLGPAYRRGQRTGELTAVVTEGVEALDAYFSQYLPQLVLAALVPLSIVCFIFPRDALSGVIMLVTAPLIPFFMVMIGKAAESVTHKQFRRLSLLSAHFLDSLGGLVTLKLFGRSKSQIQVISRVNDRYRDATLGALRIAFLSALALELLATLSTAVIAVEIGLRLLYLHIDFQTAFFILILAPEFYAPLRMLGASFHNGMAGASAARRIYEILDAPAYDWLTQKSGSSSAVGSRFAASRNSKDICPAIILDHVSFQYPNESELALRDIYLVVPFGRHIALVGRVGAGKSTLISLLLGFNHPTAGRIVDQDGSEIPAELLRSQIGWVPQKPHLFHDTIAANLRIARPDASEAEMIQAAEIANLRDFILSQPEKFETRIGEGGARLSGGEAQRLALARAFLKKSPILIMDESTSQLDPESEFSLEQSIRQLKRGRTVITIAHRLNTILNTDQIVLLETGRIIETGTHCELLARKGIYAAMVAPLDHKTFEPQRVPFELIKPIRSPRTAEEQKQPVQIPNQKIIKPAVTIRLLSFLNGSWRAVALSVGLMALTIGSGIALVGTSAWLISTAALHPSIAELGLAIVGVRFFGICRALSRYSERLVSHNVTLSLLARLRVWFYKNLEPLAPARLMHFRAGDILARIVADVNTLENFYVRVLLPPLAALLIGIGVSAWLTSYRFAFALILIGTFMGAGLLLPILIGTSGRKSGLRLVGLRADLYAWIVDGIHGLADLLAFEAFERYRSRIEQMGKELGRIQNRLVRRNAFGSLGFVFITNLSGWLILLVAIPMVAIGQIQGLLLGALVLVCITSFEAIRPLTVVNQSWEVAHGAAQRLYEIVDSEPAVKEIWSTNQEQPNLVEKSAVRPAMISFTDLSFTYPENRQPALRDISFCLPPGGSLAIVGSSGAGKSTLVNLLVRCWDYNQGEIQLLGRSLKEYDPEEIRKNIGVLTQNSYFFNTSIQENLRLARPEATLMQIQSVAAAACIHDTILGFPSGYDTCIGEQGQRLSAGQRQGLALARLLLKDAPIVILDEPTANLDPLTEMQVLTNLAGLLKGKTILMITHRLVGLEKMDQILVMDHGRIIERGTHSSLMSQGSLYLRMMNLQNRMI